MDWGCWDLAGRWVCSDLMCSGWSFWFGGSMLVPVPWIDAVLVLETDVVPLRTMMVECSTEFM